MVKGIENPAGMSSVDSRRLKKLVEDVGQCRMLIGNVAQAANQQFLDMDAQMGRFGAILDAITELVGKDKIQGILDARAIAEATAEAENAKAQLAVAVANGDLKAADVIGPETIVVGEQVDAEGKPVPPGYCQFALNRSPEWLAPLLGQAVGAQVETPNKTVVKVTAIYDAVPKEVPAEAAAAGAVMVEPAPANLATSDAPVVTATMDTPAVEG